MKTKEKSLWQWLKRTRKQFLRLHIGRIENSSGDGDPDVSGCLAGLDFTIELKTEARPKTARGRVPIKLRDSQIEWITDRWAVGGAVFMLIQVGGGHKAARYLIPGNLAVAMPKRVFETELAAKCICAPDSPAKYIVLAAATHRWFFD